MVTQGIKSYPDLVGDEGSIQNSKRLEMRLIDYIAKRKKDGITAQTLSNHLSAPRHFYKMNDIDGIKWDKVRRYLGERVKTVDDKAYTHEQIAKAIEFADYRIKALILTQASTGMRIGGIVGGSLNGIKIPYLKWGDLEYIERHGIFSFKAYRRTSAEYLVFCTPEAAKAIKEYMRYREQQGEAMTPESPLIREQFGANKADKPRPIAKVTASKRIDDAFVRAGLRTREAGQKHRRKENMLTHGFRKFAKKWMRKSGVDPLIIEYLVGHQSGDMKAGVSKLMMTYDPAEDGELLAEYLKAIPNLTIASVERERFAKEQALKERDVVNEKYEKELLAQRQELESHKETIAMLVEAQREREELEKARGQLEKDDS